jgi:ribosomal-protein-serine acetyltransferase
VYAITLSTSPHAELRPLEPGMAEEYLAHIDRARATVDPWIPWASFSTDLDSARATLQRYADGQASDTRRIHGIWLEGTLVGGVMFPSFDAGSGNCEIGVWTEPAGSGHGLVTAAARLLVTYAFEERGMQRITWVTTPANERSSSVAKRLGMQLDGVLRSEWVHNGERKDSEVYSLLVSDWKEQQR